MEDPASHGAAVLGRVTTRRQLHSPVGVAAAAAASDAAAAAVNSHVCLPPPLPLQEAAERGELGSRSARILNAGLLLAGLVHMAVLMPVNAREYRSACPPACCSCCRRGWQLPRQGACACRACRCIHTHH